MTHYPPNIRAELEQLKQQLRKRLAELEAYEKQLAKPSLEEIGTLETKLQDALDVVRKEKAKLRTPKSRGKTARSKGKDNP